jgi:hypothetical protein
MFATLHTINTALLVGREIGLVTLLCLSLLILRWSLPPEVK